MAEDMGGAVATPEPSTPSRGSPMRKAAPRAPRKSRKQGISLGFATVRDLAAWVIGVSILYHEIVVEEAMELSAVAVAVSLLGLPLAFGADERKGR